VKRLENLPEITNDMLGGLHATDKLKKEIMKDAKAACRDGNMRLRNSAWGSRRMAKNEKRRITPLQRGLAMAAMVIVLLGSVVGMPAMIGLDQQNQRCRNCHTVKDLRSKSQ